MHTSDELQKEANMANFINSLKGFKFGGAIPGAGRQVVQQAKRVAEDATSSPRRGKMVRDPIEDTGVDSMSNVRFFNKDEIAQGVRDASDLDGTGSFVGDIGIGLSKLLTPKSWDVENKLQNASYQTKRFLENIDTKAGSALAGNDPTSFRGRIFSVPTGRNGMGVKIGEKVNKDGSVSPIMEGTDVDQRPSLFAPVVNSYKLATPFLATGFLANQFFPQNQQPPMAPAQTIDPLAVNLDKQASLSKIAQLEDELLEKEAMIADLQQENQWFQKHAADLQRREQEVRAEFEGTKREFMAKKAEFEEFRLREVARERSKYAVKLAEEMLEQGMIKQAEFASQVDRLMECDESTFGLHANLLKEATKSKEGLESLAFLSDYYSNNDNPSLRPNRGLSKTGQTIGEAARELKK